MNAHITMQREVLTAPPVLGLCSREIIENMFEFITCAGCVNWAEIIFRQTRCQTSLQMCVVTDFTFTGVAFVICHVDFLITQCARTEQCPHKFYSRAKCVSAIRSYTLWSLWRELGASWLQRRKRLHCIRQAEEEIHLADRTASY